ncbi:hypothetical protein SAMN05428988_0157 [Chitinophaga sp. YR573]|uniref:hypothetical protein n=1 Tax=Chitinophaga sp. YR573 TaxID=1881040 RepID=UPI0008B94CE8|nr:hypothetical protein [Chitinophaga sp. YR573]SEV88915.1 hypothetical protein SAMN05428988_0157 [Chitinophaga sp. YR573]
MITTLKAIDIVWKRLNESPLKTAVNGGVYKQKRPLNSKKEDVIINSPTIVNLQLQEGLINVNIHVPNLLLSNNGAQDNSQPDHVRLEQLADIAASSLTDVWSDDGQINYDIQSQTVFEDEQTNAHYVNFRITFYSVNI